MKKRHLTKVYLHDVKELCDCQSVSIWCNFVNCLVLVARNSLVFSVREQLVRQPMVRFKLCFVTRSKSLFIVLGSRFREFLIWSWYLEQEKLWFVSVYCFNQGLKQAPLSYPRRKLYILSDLINSLVSSANKGVRKHPLRLRPNKLYYIFCKFL